MWFYRSLVGVDWVFAPSKNIYRDANSSRLKNRRQIFQEICYFFRIVIRGGGGGSEHQRIESRMPFVLVSTPKLVNLGHFVSDK